MKLRTVKTVNNILLVITIILLIVSMITAWNALLYIALVFGIADVIFQMIFWKCPHCGKNLGRIGEKRRFCSNCGKEIDT